MGGAPLDTPPLFLFLDGSHGFDGGVVQVLRCCDGQAALVQDPLGLVNVGPWGQGGFGGGREEGALKTAQTHLLGCKNCWV